MKLLQFGSSDAKTVQRLRSLSLGATDYVLNGILLLSFAVAGVIPYSVPVAMMLLSLIVNLAFFAAVGSGYTLRFRDPSVVWLQVFAASFLNLFVLVCAPQIAYMPILNLFVLLSFGSLYAQRSGFVLMWLLLSTLLVGAVWLVASIGMVVNGQAERVLFSIFLVISLGRVLVVNAKGAKLRERLHEKNLQLAVATARLEELASIDELTGLWNRRAFMRRLQDEQIRTERNGSHYCVAVLDVDHFKKVNDRHGHLVGDAVLHEIAQLLDKTRRSSDTIARYGGEEFTLLLVDTGTEGIGPAMERMRGRIERHDWNHIATGLYVTVSAGVAVAMPGQAVAEVLSRADGALYQAKQTGRNRVCVATPPAVPVASVVR